MAAHRDEPKAPPEIERIIKALVTTEKAISLYPRTSSIPRETATACASLLSHALRDRPDIRFVVAKEGLYFDDAPVFPGQSAYGAFAMQLYNQHVADVRFHVGVDARSIIGFLSLLQLQPDEVAAAGGFEMRMWDLNIANITVKDVHVAIYDAQPDDEAGQQQSKELTQREIDELLAAAYGGRAREQLTVARYLGDPSAVSRYLTDTYNSGGSPSVAEVGEKFAVLAQVAHEVSEEDELEMLRALGASFAQLDPNLRHSLLVDEVFPEARTNEALAAVIREMDLDEVCRLLVADVAEGDASREGLARALRNLSMISITDNDEIVSAAGAAMRGEGLSEGFVSEVLEATIPSRITVREVAQAPSAEVQPAEAIFKLMDLAPVPDAAAFAKDPDVVALKEEADRGITDGDVIMSLVALVALDSNEAQFATTMSMLEDSLGVLIERGDIDIAADAADALTQAAQDSTLDTGQRVRLRNAIKRFTRPSDVQAIAHAMRVYPADSPDHAAAKRLLDVLGPLAIDPLLDQLAEEEEMGARKPLIDQLSGMALSYISELGKHVTDSRWYVVRNVVSILGTTKSSAMLPYVEKVVRHPEARVRREVIRALSAVHDRLAHDLLIGALTDDDAQNVQLSARYLGVANIASAIPALVQVAKGEGRGNRDAGPRVEAVEALGRMGAKDALPALESLAKSRSIIGGSRGREVRSAAEVAVARIRRGGA